MHMSRSNKMDMIRHAISPKNFIPLNKKNHQPNPESFLSHHLKDDNVSWVFLYMLDNW